MAELHRRDQFLQIRIARVLIELAVRNLGGERLAAEIEAVIFEPDAVGAKNFFRSKCTVKAPSTGQSFLGVNRSSLSFTQNQVPAIAERVRCRR